VAPPNDAIIQPIPLYRCPSDKRFQTSPNLNSYFGVQGGGSAPDCGNTSCSPPNQRGWYVSGILFAGSNIPISSITDGTSNVFLLGESRYANVTWAASGKQDGCAVPLNVAGAQDTINLYPNTDGVAGTRGFSSYHPGGCHFALADGSVQFVSENIDLTTYRQLARRGDERPVGGFSP
jgi:prepilin-type processing-associated H-X9-DG protein